MVTLSIKFYDETNKKAITGYKLYGGDFILKKIWKWGNKWRKYYKKYDNDCCKKINKYLN